MMPIRSAPLRLIRRLGASLFLVALAGALPEPATSAPLKGVTVEQFKGLLASKNDPTPSPEDAGPALAAYRRKMRRSVEDVGSLGDVARILLLSSDWAAVEFDLDSPISRERIEKAIQNDDDDKFQRSIQDWMARAPAEDRDSVTRAVIATIKGEARDALLDRMEKRTRDYLRAPLPGDRIAAANLVAGTMTAAQRQHRATFAGAMAGLSKAAPRTQALEKSMGRLSGDIRRLLADSNPQVQIAGVRALSSLEIPSAELAAALRPLLTPQTNVAVRRAAATGLAQVFQEMAKELSEAQMRDVGVRRLDKTRPQPIVDTVTQILPVAIIGVSDSDANVRLASLEAARAAGEVLEELTGDPQAPAERRKTIGQALRVVDQVLPVLNNAAARDSQPGLRVVACHVLESLVLVRTRVHALPAPKFEQKNPDLLPNPDKVPPRGKKGASLPSRSGGRRSASKGPSQWAAARTETPGVLILPPVPLVHDSASEDVALDRPVRLTPERRASARPAQVHPASFVAPQMDELPAPTPVANPWQDTVKAMIGNLRDPDYRVRLQTVEVLETFGDQAEPAIPAMVRALCDTNKFVRWSSARTLGRFATRANQAENESFFERHAGEVVPGLVGLLNDREDPSVRRNAARALTEYGVHAGKAVPELAHVINRGDKDFILAILQTIQSVGTDAAPTLPNVAWLMSDQTQPTSVRVAAGRTIAHFGPLASKQPRVREVLRDLMLNDPNDAVRSAASNALLAIDRPMK